MNKTVFTEKLDEKKIIVERQFSAPREKVWSAWTQEKQLEKWWAPMPYKAISKSFDFSEGGQWHYYMESPEGEKHWCLVNYEKISPMESFTAQDNFCDEDKNLNPDMPSNHWENVFSDQGDHTTVLITLTFVSADDMKRIIEMGFKEGFSLGLDQLEELLSSQS